MRNIVERSHAEADRVTCRPSPSETRIPDQTAPPTSGRRTAIRRRLGIGPMV